MPTTQLYDKVFGCLAASQVGSAMGAPVEGKTHDWIKANHGWLDRLVPYHLGGEVYPPGTTEDGVERQKLMVLSIIDNGGPITARDLAKTWLKYVDEENFGILAGQQDEIHWGRQGHDGGRRQYGPRHRLPRLRLGGDRGGFPRQ